MCITISTPSTSGSTDLSEEAVSTQTSTSTRSTEIPSPHAVIDVDDDDDVEFSGYGPISEETYRFKRPRSGNVHWVWTHFRDTADVNNKQCLYCLKEVSYNRSTSHLTKHLERKHNKVYVNEHLRTAKEEEKHADRLSLWLNTPSKTFYQTY
jgi:hypothetical protein